MIYIYDFFRILRVSALSCLFKILCKLILFFSTFYIHTAYLMAVIAGVSIGLLFNILSLGTLLTWILEIAPQKTTKVVTWLTYFFTTFAGRNLSKCPRFMFTYTYFHLKSRLICVNFTLHSKLGMKMFSDTVLTFTWSKISNVKIQ